VLDIVLDQIEVEIVSVSADKETPLAKGTGELITPGSTELLPDKINQTKPEASAIVNDRQPTAVTQPNEADVSCFREPDVSSELQVVQSDPKEARKKSREETATLGSLN
jgi:hypothetical protein